MNTYPFHTKTGADYLSPDIVAIADIPSDYTLMLDIAGFMFTDVKLIEGRLNVPGMLGDNAITHAGIINGDANNKWLVLAPKLP